ncbi:hypothetical protein Pyn_20059 [Prunus yedoensis var. nudiflora]|uniref:Uncharacterized protein n=1 Tax=Prunus yedoensis var. nudiflora TaxID=2094558 RepID=A0A314Z6W0_PRUYE|nr:hypothetical protein Pyn_20059 [Prunus yedoensis var. nudiflora]
MAENSNALTFKETVLQVDHLLFLVERLAIFLVIIFPKFSCFSFIYFILTTFLCMEAFLQRQLVSKSTPNYQHVFVFLLERAATIFLVLYNWATNYWYIAMASLETEIEEESAKEENTKWEEGLVEADGQLKEKAEIEAEASKEGEGDLMQEAEDQLKEKPDTEEENTKRDDDLLEVDDSWEDLDSLEEVDDSWEEELVEADEIGSVCEIKNLRKKGEVEGTEEVERLRAENESLKREKYVLRQRLEREREAYEQEYQNMFKKMQEEFEGTLILERQLSTVGCHKRVG